MSKTTGTQHDAASSSRPSAPLSQPGTRASQPEVRPDQPTPPASRADVIDVVVRTAFVTMGVLTRLAAENDLSLTQLRVLAILRDRRLRMVELVEYLGLEKSTLTGLVTRAEKRGLLLRAPSATDGRGVDVFLSDEGLALAERIATVVEEHLGPWTTRLDPAEQQQLHDLLTRLVGPERRAADAPGLPA